MHLSNGKSPILDNCIPQFSLDVGHERQRTSTASNCVTRTKVITRSIPFLVLLSLGVELRFLFDWTIPPLDVGNAPMTENLQQVQQQNRDEISTPRSPLHDQTLDWDHTVRRVWFENRDDGEPKPAFMLTLTNFGWNQPDQEKALMLYRSLRGRQLVHGWINHPWFHPTAFEDIVKGEMAANPNVTYIVLPDFETCPEGNWPVYGTGLRGNVDSLGSRRPKKYSYLSTKNMASFSLRNEIQAFFQIVGRNRTRLIKFDCKGKGPQRKIRDDLSHLPMIVTSYSARLSDIHQDVDQGLPPPGAKIANLTNSQVEDINTCQAEKRRRFFLSFVGNYRGKGSHARGGLARFHDNNRTIVLRYTKPEFNNSIIAKMEYTDVLTSSVFAAAPRGDNKFSYRFTEVLAAGAIPVVLSDDWVFPFRPEVVDWNECAVIIPENRVNETMVVLESISVDRRCRMRRTCWSIYERYMSSPVRIISGLLEGVERLSKGERARFAGVHCTDVASSNPLNHSYTQLQTDECYKDPR